MKRFTSALFGPAVVRASMILAILAILPPVASAQQQMYPRGGATPGYAMPMVVPGNQGSGGGATLELPTGPGRQLTPQMPPPPPAQQELVIPRPELRSQPGYEQVTVTATDSHGAYVTGLNKDDFRLYMDGQQRPIEFFRQDLNTPVSIGILVDTSGSMEPKMTQARAAISQFLIDLNDRDDVFLFAFSSRPFLLQSFTTDHSLVMRRLSLLHAYGQTSMYDAVISGLNMVQRGRYDKKALLVVTDGQDNTSMHGLEDVVAQARHQGVLIYCIGIGDPTAAGPGLGLLIGPFAFGGEDRVDVNTLRTLSSESGGKTFVVREIGDGGLLRTDCETISRELREQYTIGFTAPNPTAGGYRSLKVDIPTRPDIETRVRKGIEVAPSAFAGGSAYP